VPWALALWALERLWATKLFGRMRRQERSSSLAFHKDLLMPPSTADLRRFLLDAFGDEDLKTLCFDYFRDVYDDFTTGMTKGQMIHILIERCDRRDALSSLCAALRAERGRASMISVSFPPA
jgi:hypothetical protein